VLQQLYDPSTTQGAAQNYARLPFANNQIPIGRISPLARTLYAATPLPNRPDNPLINSNLNDVNQTSQTVPNYSTRFDHVFSENNRGYFRFTEVDQQQQALRNYPVASPANIEGGGLPAGATGFQRIPIQTISGATGFSHVFSPTFFSETIYSMQWQRMYVEGNQASMANYEQQLGLPNNLGNPGFPAIGAANGSNPALLMPYGGSQWNYGMSQRLITIDQNFNKILGKHQFAFGARWRHEKFGYMSDRSPDQIQFTNLATAIYDPATTANYSPRANTGYVDADFFLGAAGTYTQNRNAPYNLVNLQEFDFYFQDNFRVSQRLTLNMGLRWEAHPAPRVANDLLVTFDVKNNAIATPRPLDYYLQQGITTQAIITNLQNLGARFETLEQGGMPSHGMNGAIGNVLPRFGFAYTPSFGRGGTVIRGGYGEYIYPVPVRNSVRYLTASYPFTAGYSQSYTSGSFAPDGLPNRLLREPIAVVAGLNSQNVVNTNSITALLPGISTGTNMNTDYPPARVREINFTIEQPFQDGSVFRASYVYTHGWNLDQNLQYNNAPSAYVWQATTGTTPPTGAYANTATRPYDQTLWGGNVLSTKYGWSNNNALQLNYQRPYRKGYGFQVFYVLSKSFRVGGNTFRDNLLYPAQNYAPGVLPADMPTGTLLEPSKEFNRYQNYRIEPGIPLHRVTFNGIADLPFGKGKKFLGDSNKAVNALVGGWQVAFVGTMVSQAFQPISSNWGATSPIELYKDAVPINDCRSGVCRPGNLWFNGYIAPNLVNTSNGVQGIPDGYQPYQAPINNTPGAANFGNNNVPMNVNGRQVLTPYLPAPVNGTTAAGSNPYAMTVLQGPKNFQTDMSLYKVFDLTERWKLRLNIDAFNAFNIQGLRNPDSTSGIQDFQTSYWTPRQIQLTARLSF
jgi:hypothetical protein